MITLTGRALPLLLGTLAVGLFVLVVLGRPRPPRRWVRRLARGGEVLVLNLVVVLLAGVVLNDQYDFFVSWSDLAGPSVPPTTQRAGATPRAAATARPLGPGLARLRTPAVLPPLPQPGARIQTYTVIGAVSGVQGTVLVVLPPGYDPASSRDYPVIEAFHGYPGVPLSAEHALRLPGSIDATIRRHEIAPSIVVIPQTDNPNRLDTECMNAPAGRGPQVETWLSRDIPIWVVHHFRVARTRTSWAALGYSLGGWCSAMIGMRHPDIFGAAVVFMGYFHPEFLPTYDPIAPGSPAAQSHNLVRLAAMAPPPIALWVMAARNDRRAFPTTSAFVRAARAPLSVTSVIESSGGHTVSQVPSLLPRAMTWLSGVLAGFHP